MQKAVQKIASLFLGFLLYAVGILLTIHSNLGTSPWDAFHLGIVNHSSFTLGQVSQLVGIVIIVICIILGEIPGWGTLTNMYFIGFFIDIIQAHQWIGTPDSLLARFGMIFAGIFLIGWATYFYLSAALGSGPRDGLMLALSRKLKKKVGVPRTIIELTVLVMGYFMGGPIGIGTLLTALLVGPAIQLTYAIMGTDARETRHRSLVDDYHKFVPVKVKAEGSKIDAR